MVERSGIKFFLDIFQEPISKVSVGFDFISGFNGNNLVYPEKSTFGLTGYVNNTGSFYDYQGTGFFDGNTLISFNKPVNFNMDYSFLFSFEKLRPGNEILFSSFNGDQINNYSGFYVGVNDANKLYFTYWNPIEGAFTFTYSNILSDKNLILINRNNDGMSIGRFNNNKKIFDIETFSIYRNVFQQSNNLFIGGFTGNNSIVNNAYNFSGFIDRFYLLNNISLIYIDTIVSGLFSSPTGVEGFTDTICYNTGYLFESGYSFTGVTGSFLSGFITGSIQVTGEELVQTGYCYQTITGYETIERGRFINDCNREQIIYEKVPLSGEKCDLWFIARPVSGFVPSTGYVTLSLTGTITGTTGIFITGVQCDSYFIITGDAQYNIETDYLESLSFSEASLLFNTKTRNDIIEIYKEPFNLNYIDYNQPLRYNSLESNYFYIDRVFNIPNEFLLFANGQLLVDSGYRIENMGYEQVRIPLFDYFLTGDYIETQRNFGDRDFIFYDYFTGDFNAFIITGNYTSGSPIDIDLNNAFVFLNGQKLIPNLHYQADPIGLNTLNINMSGNNVIVTKKISNNFNYVSGNEGTLSIDKTFNNYCSQLYYNGIRQKLFNNYIENSKFDKISGTFNFIEFPDILYNNTDDFFETSPE